MKLTSFRSEFIAFLLVTVNKKLSRMAGIDGNPKQSIPNGALLKADDNCRMRLSREKIKSASIIRYLCTTGFALWALVMALEPNPGFDAPWPWIALFWALQISVGLIVLQMSMQLILKLDNKGRLSLWLLVCSSGFLGAALLTPIYWLIGEGFMQQVLGFPQSFDGEGQQSDLKPFGLAALVEEWLNISGPVIASWALIAWPRLQGLVPPMVQSEPTLGAAAFRAEAQALDEVEEGIRHWRKALPAALGEDVIVVKSELQYLRVWTTRGCGLVLGSLNEVEEAEGSAGMRVHRSWWVHGEHVRMVRRRGEAAICELSDGREVPVSRRRKADALARFGERVRYDVMSSPSDNIQSRSNQNPRRKPS